MIFIGISLMAAPQRKYRFPLRKPGLLSCCTKLCLWRADGDIRRAQRSPNIPPDNDPCPTKIAHPTWKRKGGRVGTSNFRCLKSCWINSSQVESSQLGPSPPPSIPARKSYYFIEISDKVYLHCQWISIVFHWNSNWISTRFPLVFHWLLNWISNG